MTRDREEETTAEKQPAVVQEASARLEQIIEEVFVEFHGRQGLKQQLDGMPRDIYAEIKESLRERIRPILRASETQRHALTARLREMEQARDALIAAVEASADHTTWFDAITRLKFAAPGHQEGRSE